MKRGQRRNIRGELYKCCLLKVEGTDAAGKPRKLTLYIDENEPIEIQDGDEFITAYIAVKALTGSN